MKKIILLSLLAAVTASAADYFIPVPVSVAFVENVQSGSTTINNIQTFKAAAKYTLATKGLAAALWSAEYQNGKVASPSNIIGAQLVLMTDVKSLQNSYFAFYFAGAVICDCSDVMEWSCTSAGVATAGKNNLSNNTMTGETYTIPAKINYDDTGAGGSLKFDISGLTTWTGNDSAITTLNYTEKISTKATFSGGGTAGGQNFFIQAGTFAGAGNSLLWF
jgi:hypothetical protein